MSPRMSGPMRSRAVRRGLGAAAALILPLALLSACAPEESANPESTETSPSAEETHHEATEAEPGEPLRDGETRVTVAMEEPYTPSAPTGKGTDDYRCFLLDPGLNKDSYLTGTHVLPGDPTVVHHVILFKVAPEDVASAKQLDAEAEGAGWTCFGGTGLQSPADQLNDANWIAAWAPGSDERVTKDGYGTKLAKGTQVIMQVHYNLLQGPKPDVSATQLRLASTKQPMTELSTMLLPAPVEMPCREEYADGPLCSRQETMLELMGRFGADSGTADALHLLCGDDWTPGERSSCVRDINEPMTIHGVAGHMHLLGREIKVVVNPGTPKERTILDIPVWDFDDQGMKTIDPVKVAPGDQVEVTCRHVQWLRDKLPAFEGQPDRYVVWGDGTTDEMCLGMLSVSKS